MPKPNIVSLPPKRPEASKPPAHTPQRFLSLRDVLDRLTISRSLLYELIKDPVQPFPRRCIWDGAASGSKARWRNTCARW